MAPASASPPITQILLFGLATAAAAVTCWAAWTPSGQAWARRVWEGDREGARKRKAMKQLRFLEARLGELSGQIETCGRRLDEVVARGRGGEDDEAAPEEEGEEEGEGEQQRVSAYYHFDSSGRKFQNKWDSYDVDEELARLDAEDGGEENDNGGNNGTAAAAGTAASQRQKKGGAGGGGRATLGRVRTEVGQLNHDLERLMGYLDQVRGDEEIKARRKAIVQASHEVFTRLDTLTQRLLG